MNQTRSKRPAEGSSYDAVIAALARRAHSRAELGRKLIQKGHAAAEVEAALNRAAELGYLDDARYAAAVVARRSANRGPAAIAAELRAKGLSRAETDAALSGLDQASERAVAARLAERLIAPGADRAQIERAAAKLLRRGFSSEAAWTAVRTAAAR